MKTMKKLMLGLGILLISVISVFADEESTNVISGENYSVFTTEEVQQFNGKNYEVYSVKYDNPELNIKIAVNEKEYIVYASNFIVFYESDKHGFGVRKVLFANPYVKNDFDIEEYSKQVVLYPKRKIEKTKAIELISFYFPKMRICEGINIACQPVSFQIDLLESWMMQPETWLN